MGIFWNDAQPAVKKETKRVAFLTCMGTVVMWGAFAVLHRTVSDKIPFDYRVILGGVGGTFTAVFNFFLMGLAVQEIAVIPDEERARARMQASYTKRMLLQILWIILAVTVPFFQFAAGLIPLFFPGTFLKLQGIRKSRM